MKRILFVDDESRVLDGLRRLLRGQRREWEMVFALGPHEALAELEAGPFDVVVTDMRMPEMDGAELLGRVERAHPQTVRLVLSGHSELDSVLRAAKTAHQFLSKPCEGQVLVETIQRTCLLQGLLRSPELLRIAGDLEPLPALPRAFEALNRALDAPEVSLTAVGEIVQSDPALCAKLLRFVNSSFFGVRQEISDPQHAVSYLGVQALRNLVLSLEVFEAPGTENAPDVDFVATLQRHSTQVARLARAVVGGGPGESDAFVAGMLHDVGLLLLASRAPQLLEDVSAGVRDSGRPLCVVEGEVLGVGHAELGAYLLGLWGLPAPIVEAVAHHHHPSRGGSRGLDALAAVYVAEALLAERAGAPFGGSEADGDTEFIAGLGLSDRMDDWRQLVDGVIESTEGGEA